MKISDAPVPHPLSVLGNDWARAVAAAVVGSRWPAGDESATWDVADRWYELADTLSAPRATAFRAADQIVAGLVEAGIAPDGFREAWHRLSIDEEAPLNALVQIAAELGQLIEECGREIEAAKLAMWLELGTLLTELAGLQVATELTLGAAAPAAEGLIAAGRVAIAQISARLVEQVGGAAPDGGPAASGRHKLRMTRELLTATGLAAGVAHRHDPQTPTTGTPQSEARPRTSPELPAPLAGGGPVTRRLVPPRRTDGYRHPGDRGLGEARRLDPAERGADDRPAVGRPTIPMQRMPGRHDRDVDQVRRAEYADFLATVAEGIRAHLTAATSGPGTSAGRALRAYADEVETEAALVRSRPRAHSATSAPDWARGDPPPEGWTPAVPDRDGQPRYDRVTRGARQAEGERRERARGNDEPHGGSAAAERAKHERPRSKRTPSSSARDDRTSGGRGTGDRARRERVHRNRTQDDGSRDAPAHAEQSGDRTRDHAEQSGERTRDHAEQSGERTPDHAEQSGDRTRDHGTQRERVHGDWAYGDKAQAMAAHSPGGLRAVHRVPRKALEDAVPRAGDGRAERLPDPRVGRWFPLLNAGGPSEDPTRGLNCLDAVLALFETYQRRCPRVAAARTFDGYAHGEPDRPVGGEWSGVRRIQQATRGEFQNLCPFVGGAEPEPARAAIDAALRNLANHLHNEGHGAFAFILTDFETGGCHAWAAVNQGGTILYLDPQLGRIAVDPLYRHHAEPGDANVVSMDALVVDGDGNPAPLPYHGAGQWTAQAILEGAPG